MSACPFCGGEIKSSAKIIEHKVLVACPSCMNPVVAGQVGAGWALEIPKNTADVRETMAGESIGGEILGMLPDAAARLPVMPETAQRIFGMVQDLEVQIADLANLIRQDQVLAVKILQLANSAMFGGLSEIKEIDAACARLGLMKVGNAVQAIANGKLYVSRDQSSRSLMRGLWRHAVATAHCAGLLAQMLAEPRADMLFVAGLTHDIGKVLLLDIIANPVTMTEPSELLVSLRKAPDLIQEVLTNFHALAGLYVIQHWKLPPEFGVTVYCHKHVDAVPDGHWNGAVHIVSLASTVADLCGYGIHPREEISLLSHPSAKYLGMNDMKLAMLRVDLEESVQHMLDISMM